MLAVICEGPKEEGTMKTFVVRVYRPSTKSEGELVGLVDHVGEERQSPFRSLEELRRILMDSPDAESVEPCAGRRGTQTPG